MAETAPAGQGRQVRTDRPLERGDFFASHATSAACPTARAIPNLYA